MGKNMWDERYAGGEYFFGTKPNAFYGEPSITCSSPA